MSAAEAEAPRNRPKAAQTITGGTPVLWRPHPGPQARFLTLTTLEVLFGGQAGGSKTESLILDAIRYVGRGYGSAYQGLLLRREMPDLRFSIIPRCAAIYPALGGRWNSRDSCWMFPAGEKIFLSHLQYDSSVHRYQGAEFQYVGFDELTTFTKYSYTYLFSRVRSSKGVPCRVRGATNPGGEGHDWVLKRWAPWLYPAGHTDYQGPRAGPGETLYFLPSSDETDEEKVVRKGTRLASGRTFLPSRLSDNPSLGEDYEARLLLLDPVTRARLRHGDWLIKPAAGLYFKRHWWQFAKAVPHGGTRVRAWDLAATEPKNKNDPDWTVGIRMTWVPLPPDRRGNQLVDAYGRPLARWFIDDVIRIRATPGVVAQTVRTTALMDGTDTTILLQQDPGQAGKSQIADYKAMLAGFTVKTELPSGDKVQRASPYSTQVEAGNVYLVTGEFQPPPWIEVYVSEHASFPDPGVHDDQVDASASAFWASSHPVPRGNYTGHRGL